MEIQLSYHLFIRECCLKGCGSKQQVGHTTYLNIGRMRVDFMKIITNLILSDREVWVEAQWVTQVLYYNDSEEENWSYCM